MEEGDSDEKVASVETEPVWVGFSQVVGLNRCKQQLMESVVLPLGLPRPVREILYRGIRHGARNVLLYGPPGCGKTMLARASAFEARAAFFSVSPGDLLSQYVGQSEKRLRELFKSARCFARSIVFFDEIDAIAASRQSDQQGGRAARQLLCELLVLMNTPPRAPPLLLHSHSPDAYVTPTGAGKIKLPDMLMKPTTAIAVADSDNSGPPCSKRSRRMATATADTYCSDRDDDGDYGHDNHRRHNARLDVEEGSVVVMAATNRVADLDEAVLRRFESKVLVGLPSAADRRELLTTHLLADIDAHLSTEDMGVVVDITEGWNPSEMEVLARDAAMHPLRDVQDTLLALRDSPARQPLSPLSLRPVILRDFQHAYEAMFDEAHNDCPTDDRSGSGSGSEPSDDAHLYTHPCV
jgi:SpoVK/Ycf46/Vps4 family AAA+-type ATPase